MFFYPLLSKVYIPIDPKGVALVSLISDMVNRRRFLAGLGSLAIGSGALMQSGAFSTVRGDRGVSVQTAADPDALLGLEGVDDASTTPRFENNASVSMDVTLESTDSSVEFDVGDTGSFTDTATFSFAAGNDREVAIDGDASSAPVSVTAELPSSNDPQATISLTRDYVLNTQADQIKLTSNVSATGNSGKYEFELENTGSVDVTLVGIGINETSTSKPAATEVSGGKILDVVDNEGSVLSTPIPVDSSSPNQNTRVGFTEDVSLGSGSPKTFEFDRFQDSGGSKVGMKRETVKTTLYFSDGSSKTVTLSP